MSAVEVAEVITAHAWSPDGSRLALCENEPDVIIYSNISTSGDASTWKKEHILKRHTMVVVGIDWARNAAQDRLVTCSHDVNAFVWTYDQAKNRWDPALSVLRIDKAALRCMWSPDASKFAVASSSKLVSVCYYQQTQNWWVSKLTQKGQHRSTVLDVAWHPSSQIFATACADFKCRVISAFIAESDQVAAVTPFGNLEKMGFGNLITEFESTGAWIEACAWSPSGNQLVFAGHDSTISFVSFVTGQPVVTPIKLTALPFLRVLFLNEAVVVGAGHDFQPEVFQQNKDTWDDLGSCDVKSSDAAPSSPSRNTRKGAAGGFLSRMNQYESRIKKGTTDVAGDQLLTKHHNVITDISPFKGGFTTSGDDGRIVFWSKEDIKSAVSNIRI